MGTNDSQADTDEKPAHTVYVDAFYMDRYPVTNAQYKEFVDANSQWQKDRILGEYSTVISNEYTDHPLLKNPTTRGYNGGQYLKHWKQGNYPSRKAEHPVVFVSWYGALAYAQWVGKRLPTEAEWEKAARGGLVDQRYSWGNTIETGKANHGKLGVFATLTTPVGNYPPNDYDLYDMAGNVFEWCLDEYDSTFYTHSPDQNPVAGETRYKFIPRQLSSENPPWYFKNFKYRHAISNFTEVETRCVLRGGSWNNHAQFMRVTYRHKDTPISTMNSYGFRCVRAVTP